MLGRLSLGPCKPRPTTEADFAATLRGPVAGATRERIGNAWLAVPWLEVSGLRVAFERTGEGPPLVLVHGAVSDRRVWRPQLDAFANQFTVVAWDAPGCGQSEDPPESFRLPDYADVLAGLIAALELSPAYVLGHSFGGALALELALRHPTAVAKLVVAGGYAGWAGSLPATDVERRLAFALDVAERLPGGFDPSSMPGLYSAQMSDGAAAALRTVMSEIRPAATRSMAHALAEADLRAALPSISVPTLLINGDADERSSPSVARDLHRRIRSSRLVVLPGLGHECALEDPDRFNSEVRTFLLSSRQSAGRGSEGPPAYHRFSSQSSLLSLVVT
jgi:pimeloyl-ACP methyl ester carboxylesterase